MIQAFNTLKAKAKIALMTILGERLLSLLEEDQVIFKWISNAFSDVWSWLENEGFTSDDFYQKYLKNQVVENIGAYQNNKAKREAFLSQLDILYFVCREIAIIRLIRKQRKASAPFPADIAETEDGDILLERIIETALKIMKDTTQEKTWQEQLINQLKKDFYTEDENEIGEPITREYFEEFL